MNSRRTAPREEQELSPSLCVIMPACSEAGTITEVVQAVLEQSMVQELIVVDDASTDGTWIIRRGRGE